MSRKCCYPVTIPTTSGDANVPNEQLSLSRLLRNIANGVFKKNICMRGIKMYNDVQEEENGIF